ncbi:mRNA interferase YafQ [Lactobacillus bombicola]|uniref:mRNA interferase YafQ n=1 Tax=Lactobacillus bombicola TaxID=1505723 RepID=A0A1I1SQ94_9LACO|nr:MULTISPECIES: type II toxin-antitoxin system YafQ family toxin [Lactobacillus]MCO6527614.1 type II toxin-antitoxin system YafQ family toxin [Lactobacillus sp.]RMC42271.1 type II toxin-antitoxin system YafQ family toxin [Lactobacillus sp. ESL0233]RMC46255.1 type II toxin-antitoxin system YafQ family toxin [Lactobacillus sp. ESL0230]SFD46898.1 mRNA interferase YafQ [Lactobacillus bombicola]
MYKIKQSRKFKKSAKQAVKQGKDLNKLFAAVEAIITNNIGPKYHDHELKGKWQGIRELHIEPDWLLTYQIKNNELILYLVDTGSHRQLFDK